MIEEGDPPAVEVVDPIEMILSDEPIGGVIAVPEEHFNRYRESAH